MSGKVIGIIGAMDCEIKELLQSMQNIETEEISSIQYHKGLLDGVQCVVAQCGPGKVNAAICAQTIILQYNPRLVINIGVAGGIGRDVHIGDLVVGTACIQHDFITDGEETRGVVPGIDLKEIPCDGGISEVVAKAAADIYDGKVHMGIIVTGDEFVASAQRCNALAERFHAKACEMEGGSIAHVCLMNGVPVAVLRSISDNANDQGSVDFYTFAEQSAKKSQLLLSRVINKL